LPLPRSSAGFGCPLPLGIFGVAHFLSIRPTGSIDLRIIVSQIHSHFALMAFILGTSGPSARNFEHAFRCLNMNASRAATRNRNVIRRNGDFERRERSMWPDIFPDPPWMLIGQALKVNDELPVWFGVSSFPPLRCARRTSESRPSSSRHFAFEFYRAACANDVGSSRWIPTKSARPSRIGRLRVHHCRSPEIQTKGLVLETSSCNSTLTRTYLRH